MNKYVTIKTVCNPLYPTEEGLWSVERAR